MINIKMINKKLTDNTYRIRYELKVIDFHD